MAERCLLDTISWPNRGPNVDRRLAQPCGAEAAPQPKVPANDAVQRRSSPRVGMPASACHAGGRGFESRRSRKKHPANRHLSLPALAQSTAGFYVIPALIPQDWKSACLQALSPPAAGTRGCHPARLSPGRPKMGASRSREFSAGSSGSSAISTARSPASRRPRRSHEGSGRGGSAPMRWGASPKQQPRAATPTGRRASRGPALTFGGSAGFDPPSRSRSLERSAALRSTVGRLSGFGPRSSDVSRKMTCRRGSRYASGSDSAPSTSSSTASKSASLPSCSAASTSAGAS
jgi:hypothetical protein